MLSQAACAIHFDSMSGCFCSSLLRGRCHWLGSTPCHEECGANLGPQACSPYCSEYNQAIRDGTSVVLVAEDTVIATEETQVYPALREATAYTLGASTLGPKLVVGVASVDMNPGSLYAGLLQPHCEPIILLKSSGQELTRAKAPWVRTKSATIS